MGVGSGLAALEVGFRAWGVDLCYAERGQTCYIMVCYGVLIMLSYILLYMLMSFHIHSGLQGLGLQVVPGAETRFQGF